MAVAQAVLNDTQRSVLEALCDTFVPSVEFDTSDPVEKEFMARAASDLAVAAQVEGLMADAMVPAEIEAFAGLLDALAGEGFLEASLEERTAMVHSIGDSDADGFASLPACARGCSRCGYPAARYGGSDRTETTEREVARKWRAQDRPEHASPEERSAKREEEQRPEPGKKPSIGPPL